MNNPIFKMEDAVRLACKASIMIEGLSGSGKSGLALAIGEVLTNKDWKKICVIDTENRSARLFNGIPNSNGGNFGTFKVIELTSDVGFKPSNYLIARDVAVKNGCEVVISDSISHAWSYAGGVLDLVNQKATNDRDKYSGWKDPEVSSEKNKLLDIIRSDKVHIITTVRVKEKQELVYEPDKNGVEKLKIKSLGEQQIQQGDLKYEPDLVLQMVSPGNASVTPVQYPVAKVIKTRYAIFTKGAEYEFTPKLLQQLKTYLEEGTSVEELLAQQKADYVTGVTDFLDSHKNMVMIWKELKKNAGFEKTKLEDIPLEELKKLFISLTAD